MLGAVFALLVLGAVEIYSVTGVGDELARGDGAFGLRKHLRELLLGLVLMVAMAITPPEVMRRFGIPALVLAVIMLMAVLVPGIGREYNGSRRWFSISGVSFQPSEFAKIAMIVFIAGRLAGKKRRELKRFMQTAAVPLAVVFAIALLIFVEPNLSTAAFVVLCGSVLMLVGGVRLRHLAKACGAALLLVLLALGAVVLAGRGDKIEEKFSYAADRFEPSQSYQVQQSIISFALGGPSGVGPGRGLQQRGFVPFCDSDFILAIIGLELGFAGSAGVIVLFGVFVLSGLNIALRCKEPFSALVCFGILFGIGLQAAIHVAVVTGCAPTTGIALPFISRGGSAMMMSLASVGILLSVARTAARRAPEEGKRVIARSIVRRRGEVEIKEFTRR